MPDHTSPDSAPENCVLTVLMEFTLRGDPEIGKKKKSHSSSFKRLPGWEVGQGKLGSQYNETEGGKGAMGTAGGNSVEPGVQGGCLEEAMQAGAGKS